MQANVNATEAVECLQRIIREAADGTIDALIEKELLDVSPEVHASIAAQFIALGEDKHLLMSAGFTREEYDTLPHEKIRRVYFAAIITTILSSSTRRAFHPETEKVFAQYAQ